jgi:hypothetical protein
MVHKRKKIANTKMFLLERHREKLICSGSTIIMHRNVQNTLHNGVKNMVNAGEKSSSWTDTGNLIFQFRKPAQGCPKLCLSQKNVK